MSDDQFLHAALAAIRELGEIVTEHRRANHRLDSLVDDLHAVALRYLTGNHCSGPGCRSSAKLPPIVMEVFCCSQCKAANMAAPIEEELRIKEAVAEHTGGRDG